MKKTFITFLVLIASVFISIQQASAENNLKAAALKKLQIEVVKSLPVESDMARLAVLDFEGDDGIIRNAITTAIMEKTSFKVIERADLDKILEEQGLQLKDVMDERTRVTHGKIKGVQGLLFGKVVGMQEGFMSYTITVNMKLDDVEKGEIVLSKDLSVSAVSPIRQWIVYGILGVFLMLSVIAILKKRNASVIKTAVKEDVKARRDLVKEISKAALNISEAKAKLMEKGKTDEAVFLKDAEKDILLLKQYVENAVRGDANMNKAKEFKEAREFDSRILSSFEDLTRSADKVYEVAIAGNSGKIEGEVDMLRKGIKNLINEFKDRGF